MVLAPSDLYPTYQRLDGLILGIAIAACLAQLSYVIYLVHKGVNHVVQTLIHDAGGDEESTLTFVLCVITSIAVAALLHLAVERPALRLGQRLLSRYSKKTS